MIEIELRGRLTNTQALRLRALLRKHGKHLETHNRVQILLFDYPGYHANPTKRKVDVRLRDTDGQCEIMVKKKVSTHNTAREEISLKLAGTNLSAVKQVVKILGFSRGLEMHRKKEVYIYKGVEWSIVNAGKGILFFEAEKRITDKTTLARTQTKILLQAQALHLKTFSPQEYHEFVQELARKVNKRITW
ncbi:MAG: hypothetical protein G01um10148_433 [Parcubacteria group bacterium Gr01-1014_8]|nr:MAG: hypothetical protein G01um10148_433 [Parcubacteria group bacterium Gr01-1014_8]